MARDVAGAVRAPSGPASVPQATATLVALGDDAVVYAGGTELLLLMKLGFAAYAHLVDVKPIGELSGIDRRGGVVAYRRGCARTARSNGRRWSRPAGRQLAADGARVWPTSGSAASAPGWQPRVRNPYLDGATFLLASDAPAVLGAGEGAPDACR